MTCEVLVANRLGMALAADSAVTFSAGNSDSKTYASGANKIFQLCSNAPIAVMIYNGADLHQIPWEVILKSYRTELANTTFQKVSDYTPDLIRFLNEKCDKLIPPQVREAAAKAATYRGLFYVMQTIFEMAPTLLDETASAANHAAAWAGAISQIDADLAGLSVDSSLDPADLLVAHSTMAAGMTSEATIHFGTQHPHLAAVASYADVVRIGIDAAFKKPDQVFLNLHTGLVVAGFGRDEFMPAYSSLDVYGFVGTKICWKGQQNDAVGYVDRPSLIVPFARQAMVETFTQGASPEVWKAVRDAFVQFANESTKEAASRAGVAIAEADIVAAVDSKLNAFSQDWTMTILRVHLAPLLKVIANLDVEALAELAETLVMLESLKEKVTSRTQGVGGPIDVVVITKADGLVWIKRKHYFNTDLNPRYLMRLHQGA